MEINELDFYGFKPAIRGMRNSFASWDKSDSVYSGCFGNELFIIGPEDLKLMQRLYKAGGSERKFMRTIQVWCDISAPLTWWKQADTYKIGTTDLSTSTMHSIVNKKFEISDFDVDYCDQHLIDTIEYLNNKRDEYIEAQKNKEDTNMMIIWRKIIDNLPESYIQLRTVNMNYEVVARMISERQNHKLSEWHIFCNYMLEYLPYLKEIMNV